MKGIFLEGLEMPNENGFLDVRIYGDGNVTMMCGPGSFSNCKAQEIDSEENEEQ